MEYEPHCVENVNVNCCKKSSKESLAKEATDNTSRNSVKSTKSITLPQHVSTKAEKDVKSSVKIKNQGKCKENVSSKTAADGGDHHGVGTAAAPTTIVEGGKVPHKIIANWRQACDRTRDRTRDLLKRWRTLPEFEAVENHANAREGVIEKTDSQECCGWSVHIWTTWVDRFSVETMEHYSDRYVCELTATQTNKFSHFYTHLLDHNRDDLISNDDFETLIERLRHFADWSTYSPEYNILREVERGFVETFMENLPDDEKLGFEVNKVKYLTKDGWLLKWAQLVTGSRNLTDFPIWLQYFNKVLFQVINKSGSNIISKEELRAFYSSVLCLDNNTVNESIDDAYQAMTSNGDHPLTFSVYRLCFANYLLGKHPNGPGIYILAAIDGTVDNGALSVGRAHKAGSTGGPSVTPFPVDYSALNAKPEDLECYSGETATPVATNTNTTGVNYATTTTATRQHCRRSVIV